MTELYTFPPSLDSEFSRFLLAHYGVAHREVPHTLIFSSVATLIAGRTPIFPLLVDGTTKPHGVAPIHAYLDANAPAAKKLPVASAEDWTLFHKTLSTATTVFAYYDLLPLRDIMVGPLSQGCPAFEVTAVTKGYPAFSMLLHRLLKLSPAAGKSSAETIDQVMAAVSTRLADGRQYLTGDTFTLTDMAFAVAAAPAVWPPEYGGAVPPLEQTPPGLRAVIDKCRATPAGAFALRIFKDHRAG